MKFASSTCLSSLDDENSCSSTSVTDSSSCSNSSDSESGLSPAPSQDVADCANNGARGMHRCATTLGFDDAAKAEEDESGLSPAPSQDVVDGGNNGARGMHRCATTLGFDDAAKAEEEDETPVPPHEGYKKVLVTGGAGFIGSHVAEFLLARGDDVVIVDEVNDYYDVRIKETNLALLRESYPDQERLKIYRGDICDEELMEDIFGSENIGWVCHMAARAGVRPSIQDPYVYIHSNIRGTTKLMELSAKHGVRNFVFASSSSVYGGSKETFFSEDHVVDNPVSPYAASKKACELLAYTYHHLYQLNISGLRFFTVYGPRGRPDMAPYKFIDRVSRGVEIQQFGDGSSSRDYTYIDDIVDGVVRALDRPYPYEVFNLGKGSGTSLKEFIDLVQKHTGKAAKIKVMPDQPGDVPYTCADVSKAAKLLGYRSKVPFEEGIRRTVQWYDEAFNKKHTIEVCPETQANGMGRAPSMVELQM